MAVPPRGHSRYSRGQWSTRGRQASLDAPEVCTHIRSKCDKLKMVHYITAIVLQHCTVW